MYTHKLWHSHSERENERQRCRENVKIYTVEVRIVSELVCTARVTICFLHLFRRSHFNDTQQLHYDMGDGVYVLHNSTYTCAFTRARHKLKIGIHFPFSLPTPASPSPHTHMYTYYIIVYIQI